MKDFRNKRKPILRKVVKTAGAGVEASLENIKMMLTFLGVDPTEQMVNEAYGYFSQHAMSMNMNNLYDFLKSKSVVSSKDLRKKNK